MTQHDSPSLPAHGPGASRQAPEAPDDPSPSRTTRPWMPALLYTLGFLTVYLLAICTPWGQRAENPWFYLGEQGGEAAWIYPLSGAEYGSTPLPPLELSAKPTLMVGLAVIVVLTLVRRCWWQGARHSGSSFSRPEATMCSNRPSCPAPIWWARPRISLIRVSPAGTRPSPPR